MSFCVHCDGQRFDRAQVLRALRQVRRDLRARNCRTPEGALELALEAVRSLEIPHIELEDDARAGRALRRLESAGGEDGCRRRRRHPHHEAI